MTHHRVHVRKKGESASERIRERASKRARATHLQRQLELEWECILPRVEPVAFGLDLDLVLEEHFLSVCVCERVRACARLRPCVCEL